MNEKISKIVISVEIFIVTLLIMCIAAQIMLNNDLEAVTGNKEQTEAEAGVQGMEQTEVEAGVRDMPQTQTGDGT